MPTSIETSRTRSNPSAHSLDLPLPVPTRTGTKRALVVGPSGSGKSVLAKQLIQGLRRYYPSVVVMDPKGEFTLPGAKIYERYRALCYQDPAALVPIRIYRPGPNELADPRVANHIFWWVWKRKRTLLYIDEILFYARAMSVPRGLLACITTGRSLERFVGVISGTQRPSFVPLEILSESEHMYIFRLRLRHDRKRMEQSAAVSELDQLRLPEHAFWYSMNGQVADIPMRLPQSVA